jgi:hypothetical protein
MIILPSCTQNDEKKAEQERMNAVNDMRSSIHQLLVDNNISDAILLMDNEINEYEFTITIQDKFTSQNIAFIGSVDDIIRKDNRLYIISYDWDTWFYLEISDTIYNELLMELNKVRTYDNYDTWIEYIIIAKVDSVEKSKTTINAYGDSEMGFEYELDTPEIYVFKGACIDIIIYSK